MEIMATRYRQENMILRSGGAKGADQAFEKGAGWKKEIFLASDVTDEAIEFTSKYHPNWKACKPYARALHGRNAMIILGKNLDTPVDFVVCWTKDGKDSGGTGQAIRIAWDHKIKVFFL